MARMSGTDVTRILDATARGDAGASNELLPLVYEELRKLAAQRWASDADSVSERVMYHDELRITDGSCCYDAMAPRSR
jgi:hypothetical protein